VAVRASAPADGAGRGGVQVPEQVAGTLERIVQQLDVLAQTVRLVEERLSINEDRMASLESAVHALTMHQRGGQAYQQ
jgi:hypothetical protein